MVYRSKGEEFHLKINEKMNICSSQILRANGESGITTALVENYIELVRDSASRLSYFLFSNRTTSEDIFGAKYIQYYDFPKDKDFFRQPNTIRKTVFFT